MLTVKKNLIWVILLAINMALASCGSDKNKFAELSGEGNFYCGLDDAGHAKCWRYIVARDRQSNEAVPGKPLVLDELRLPKEISAQSFAKLKMRSVKKRIELADSKHYLQPWVRVCGMASGRAPACWDYEVRKAGAKPVDLSAMANFSQARLFDFGVTYFINGPATDGQASLFCYVNATEDNKFICHDSISGAKFEQTLPAGKKIAHLSVGGAICAGTETKEIYCSALTLDAGASLPIMTPALPIPNTKNISSLAVFPLVQTNIKNLAIGCLIADDKKVTCVMAELVPAAAPPQLQSAGVLPLSADLAAQQVSSLTHDYVLGADQKLIKIKFDVASNQISRDTIPPEIASKHYLSWAAGDSSACGLDRDSKEVSCFKVDGFMKALTSESIPAP